MSYIDERVNFLVDSMGGAVLTALEQEGVVGYTEPVRTAVASHREDIAEIIRDSFRNGLQAGRKRTSPKAVKPKR